MLASFTLLLAACTALASAKVVTYDFDIGWVTAAPDGYSRQVIGINGKWPVPMIEADVGDTIIVNAKNSLGNQATSLHFHGMFQQGSAQSDGPVSLTQCAIQPGGSYTYTFIANPAGTHWYHSHNKGQYPDGLRGKMVIHDKAWESSLNINSQMTYSMSDWYHRQMPDIINDYMSPSNTNGDLPSPDSILFDDKKQGQNIQIAAGKRYLLRIVNVGALACGQFHIEGYKLNVVETDGVQVQSTQADTILICAGQSYGVVVEGKSASLGLSANANYIVKLTTDMLTSNIPPASQITIIGNIVQSLLGSLLSIVQNLLDLNWAPAATFDDFNLKPLDGQKLLSPVDNKIELATNQTFYPGIGTRTGLGPQPWVPAKVPSLFTALTTGNAALDPATYGPGVNPWVVRSGQVVQIHLQNTHPYPHPMHLHGHVFQIVAKGVGSWNGNEGSLPAVPSKRDGAVVPAEGYIVLRFKADNPGVWFFHCHIDLHLVGGMAATIIEAPDVLQSQQSISSASQGLCSASNSPSSGNCNGGQGAISASDAASKCNNVYNFKGPNSAVVS
ncbi:laccase-2 precursor [Boeremia exigua]|uniref:laccase-2 precursor n=1 Tax=Boeremia exigua TaxID=749465 RepID=UPI001E8EB142|nr:laccase-2 precursor [Boeremia exigua]KAH6629092.1 laccase-2 precursor [Boeremia exigua]